MQELAEFPVPSHFVILPRASNDWKVKWLNYDSWGLHLVCAAPKEFHLATNPFDASCKKEDEYKIKEPKKFLAAVAPYVAMLLRHFQDVPLIGFAVPDELPDLFSDMQRVTDSLPALADAIAVARDEHKKEPLEFLHACRGPAIRELQQFLDNVEGKSRHYQGLTRTVLADGSVRWLCPTHSKRHSTMRCELP